MINIPIYLVLECWVQLDSILLADHIPFNNGYMKRADTRQKMSIITTIKENKFDTFDNPGLLSYATRYFEIQTYNPNSAQLKRYLFTKYK